MGQTLTLKVKGLITNPNSLAPNLVDGALAVADNIVVDSDNIGSSRRGFAKYGNPLDFGTYDKYTNSMFNYRDTLLVQYGTTIARDPESDIDWIPYAGSYSIPDTGYKIRGVEENQNLYICTDGGVQRLDKVDGEFEDAGMVRSLDGLGSATGTGWFTTSKTVGYRMIWTKEDENKNFLVGAPSPRVVIANTTGVDSSVSLTFLIPDEITTDHKYQIYRSSITESLTDEPNDEMQLVKEGSCASGDITAGEFTVLDELDPDLRGVTLYTSPSQQGISNSNYVPPFCKDMCTYKDHVIFANTKLKQYMDLTLVSTGTGGLQSGDTITINSITFTASGSEDTGTDTFKVYTGGTPASDIQDTAFSLVKIVNKTASAVGVYAYYESGFEDVPGKMKFEAKDLGADTFYLTSDRGVAWTPELQDSGEENGSDDVTKINRVYVSKQAQPDAVPLYQYLDIGSANQPIKRVVALRDSIFIFKDDGIFRITGETFVSFSVSLFDNTTKLLAPETAVPLNNTVFAMTLQGVVSVSDTGVAVISRPIEQDLLVAIQYPAFNDTAFGVSYESDRKYLLFMPNSVNQEFPTICMCYNTFTNAWTRWLLDATAGVIKNTDDKFYYGGKSAGYTQGYVYKERKTYSLNDFVDDSWGAQIIAVNQSGANTLLTLSRSEDSVVGYWISQTHPVSGVKINSKIMAVNEVSNVITVYPASTSYTTDPEFPVSIVKPITCRLKWVANTALNPGMLKHFRDATVFFRQDTYSDLKIGYETNYQPGYTYTNVSTIDVGDWGDFGWGDYPFNGVDDTFNQPIRVGVPRQKQKCLWISYSIEGANAFSSFSVAGISSSFEVISERLTPNTRF